MHYIAKNPKNSEVYEKMVKKCKYFFIKNSILVIDKLYYNHNGWKTLIKDDMKSVDINKLLCKLWITDELHVYPEILSKNSIVSSIIPKIYQCDAKHLSLHDQNISLNEFMFLCSSVKNLRLNEVTIKNEDGTEVSFDKLIKQLPQIKEIF
uniref:Uncharacterized protein n=1 Tax=Panagrolaimus superbus TaxID=310955 RepID=A0A914Y245_9BILA